MATNHYQRMIAIPEHEYSQTRGMQQVTAPLKTELSSLMSDYQQQSSIADPHTRVQMQGETLEQMIKLKDMLRQSVKNATPRPYQSRADGLMSFMIDKIKFNERGELEDASGNVIHSSNIADLIQHAVRDRRRKITPIGWEYFLQKMHDVNAPQMLLNYDTLEEMRHTDSNKKKVKQMISENQVSKQIKSPSKFKREYNLNGDSEEIFMHSTPKNHKNTNSSYLSLKPQKKVKRLMNKSNRKLTKDSYLPSSSHTKSKRTIKKPKRYM